MAQTPSKTLQTENLAKSLLKKEPPPFDSFLRTEERRFELYFLLLGISNYFDCSKARVFVHWSQTSVGPQYWIGPGYT